MFATLAGGYPADPDARDVDTLVRAVLAEQARAGLGLLSDAHVRWADPIAAVGRAWLNAAGPGATPTRDRPLTVDAWSFAQDVAGELPVKQCLPGPYTLGRRLSIAGPGPGRAQPGPVRGPRRRAGRSCGGGLSVHPGRRGRRRPDRLRRDRAAAVRRRPHAPARGARRGRRSTPRLAGDQRWQRRHGRAGDDLRARLRQPPVRPHRRAGQLAPDHPGTARARDDPGRGRRPIADRRRPGHGRLGGRLRRVGWAGRCPDRDRSVGRPGRPGAGGRAAEDRTPGGGRRHRRAAPTRRRSLPRSTRAPSTRGAPGSGRGGRAALAIVDEREVSSPRSSARERMICERCGTENRAGRRFCKSCGAGLAASCPVCGAPAEPGDRFCGVCGSPLPESTGSEPGSAPAGTGRRSANPGRRARSDRAPDRERPVRRPRRLHGPLR